VPDSAQCFVDWQAIDLDKLPDDEVSRYMTRDPVTVLPGTPLTELAQMMVDAHPPLDRGGRGRPAGGHRQQHRRAGRRRGNERGPGVSRPTS
jgi:CBS domain-containing protein